MKNNLALFLLSLAFGLVSSQAQTLTAINENPSGASVAANAPSGTFAPGTSMPGDAGLLGFEFTPTQSMSVSALGFFAYSLGGDTPIVSIYDVTAGLGAVFTSAPVATTGNLPASNFTAGNWTYISLATPVVLTAGHEYALMAPAYFVPGYDSATVAGFTYGAGVSGGTFLQEPGFIGGGQWIINQYSPTGLNALPGNAILSANMQYTLLAAPEPSAWAMLAAGGALLLALGSRRARC